MKVGLFIPCYVDQFYPRVGIATLKLLEKLGCEVVYPLEQTCCGQPMANSGFESKGKKVYAHFVETFQDCDFIVGPTGSCVLHVKEHYDILEQIPAVHKVRQNIYELCHFLTDVLQVKQLKSIFPYKVGLHMSCHGQRGLRLAQSSELRGQPFSKIKPLLEMVREIELMELNRPDECCGFGGTFSVSEEAVSVRMGLDRIQDHQLHGVEVITATDMSCLMHLEGLLKRNQSAIQVKHIAEILNGDPL
ncbi:MAG: (Fe-S)-binding protein [Candidatus Cyclobacteriaceae bacterium M3_2C_046]